MFLVGHGRILPGKEKLAGQSGTFRAGFISLFIDRAIINRTGFHAEILYVKRLSASVLAAVAAFFPQGARGAVNSAGR